MNRNRPDCGELKSIDEFNRNRSRPDGLQFYCKSCFSRRGGETYRRKGREIKPHSEWHRKTMSADGYASFCAACCREINRQQHLRRSYGLTEAELKDLVRGQGNVCVICLRAKPVHVDHDHSTGAVRAVLCFNCNALSGTSVTSRTPSGGRHVIWKERCGDPS